MSNLPRSTAVYKTPFSRAYWRDAAAELKSTKVLVFAALMIALRVALKLVAIPLAPSLKINTAFLANALGAMVFGPVVAALAAVVSDVLGVIITGDVYFPPFALTEIAGSMIFALFLYRAKPTPTRVILSRFCICLFVNVLLQTPIMMLYYSIYIPNSTYVLTVPGIIKNLFMFPIESVVLTLFLTFMEPITRRLKLTCGPDPKTETPACEEKPKLFTRGQIVLLAVLFIFGCGCVTGYLFYHYDNTSITAGYTTQERIQTNQEMHDILQERTGGTEGPTLAVTESAYKEFLGTEITYNVAHYAVAAEGDIPEELWELKKSAAARHEDLTRIGTARIRMDRRTGQILEFSYTAEP